MFTTYFAAMLFVIVITTPSYTIGIFIAEPVTVTAAFFFFLHN